ncbi:RCC1 domain-containing protein [Bacillus massilinigeriensis]|uniref:RCC1 domain-containing protein n=1 Tax=Bacillus massilionigeriensis TaxID=1805475 RepID=UPI00096B193A|nr:Ig-like domain-containing protein [Bacillus massilionigeriensis]
MKRRMSFITVLVAALFLIQTVLPSANIQAEDNTIYWSEEEEALYQPLHPFVLLWSGDVLESGGYDIDSMSITSDRNKADFVINQYGDIGSNFIAELPNGDLSDPLYLDDYPNGFGTSKSLDVKEGSIYLIELDNGDYAKVRIDNYTSTKAQFTFVVQTDPPEDDEYDDEDDMDDDGVLEVIDLVTSNTYVTLDIGKTQSVKVTAKYSDYTEKDVAKYAEWKSANTKIATVSNGVIKAVSSGQTTIYAEYEGLTLEFYVMVNEKVTKPIKGITGTAISAGAYHTLVLKRDGTVWSFGQNQTGQLGNNKTSDSYKPVKVTGLTGVKDIAAGDSFSLALKKDGTVWMFGNPYLPIYNGVKPKPYKISSLKDIKDIAAGDQNMVALKKDGTVYVWGNNFSGQIGIGKTSGWLEKPQRVTGLTKVVSIAAGRYHTLATRSDGSVWAFGANTHGEIGNGKTGSTLYKVPYKVPSLSKVKMVSAGTYNSLAVQSNGHVYAWGANDKGSLGIGSEGLFTSKPTRVVDTSGKYYLQQIKQVDGGSEHSVAVANNGTIYTWGENVYGKLGNGKEASSYDMSFKGGNSNIPVKLSLKNVVQAEAGAEHTVALTSDGSVYAWGSNEYGQLGLSINTEKSIKPRKIMSAK